MKTRTVNKYAVFIITILLATLVEDLIIDFIGHYYKEKTIKAVLIDMLVVVLVYIPVLGLLSSYIERLSKGYLKTTKKVGTGNRGLYFGILAALVVLFFLYARYRHEILLHDLF